MALPNMAPAYTTRKNIYEAAIVRRRNHENDFREKWGDAAKYFHNSGVEASKQKAWQSDASYAASMDAWRGAYEKETKEVNLKRRRLKLADMLKEERESLQAELRNQSKDMYLNLEDMKERSETLRSAREDRRKQVAEDLMYEHWRQNSPDIRKMELEQHKHHVIDGWGQQVDDLQERQLKEKKAREEYEQELEDKRLAALELERQKEEAKKKEEQQLKGDLKLQVLQLKERESEAEKLKEQQDNLMKEQWHLEDLEDQRKAVEKERQKVEFGRVLLRQHAAALRRKSQQIQEELEQDRKFLEKLIVEEEKAEVVQTARRDEARADARWMKEVIEEQLRLEKSREAELDMLYQDEAARQWDKREAEWARERVARERLMKEVLNERQQQVQIRMEEVRQQQAESLERREELLHEIEIANQLTRRDDVEKEAAKVQQKQEIIEQMTARKERDEAAELRLQLDLDEEKEAEENYEEMLRQEAERMSVRGFHPKTYPRKQAWM